MQCPVCHTIDIGKVGTNQYYCWHCLMEFRFLQRQKASVFYVEADGSLVPVAGGQEQS